MRPSIIFNLNNNITEYTGDPSNRLLDVLRLVYQLTGTKCGCKEGECGACSVILDGKLVNSCLVAMGSLAGAHVITIEGYATTEAFQVLSDAYKEESAVQCGYCIPGMVLASACLLASCQQPDEAQIRRGIAGNLCRCTGYNSIVRAVSNASKQEQINWIPSTSNLYVPTSLDSAMQTRAYTTCIPYTGGTDLMVEARRDANYLFLNQVPEMREIVEDSKYIRIGAAVTFTELIEHALIPQIVKDACLEIAAPAIRNAGTLGGNIGNGSAKADAALICMLLDAELRLESIRGRRDIMLRDFYRGNKRLDLATDELIVEILIPKRNFDTYYHKKVGARNALAIARTSFAAVIEWKDGRIHHFATAFGAVSEVILRPYEIDALFVGHTKEEAQEMRLMHMTALYAYIQPIRGRVSEQYRKDVCMNLLSDALDVFLG